MKEYEVTFRVNSIEPFLKYCRENGYHEYDAVSQNRIVYESKNCRHLIARLTTEVVNRQEKTVFDFKNVNRKSVNLTISNESLPMELDSENMKVIKSMLDVLEFEVSANNFRTRYVFEKENIKFEIDDYTKPEMKIVAIEGDEKLVEQIRSEISESLSDCIEI